MLSLSPLWTVGVVAPTEPDTTSFVEIPEVAKRTFRFADNAGLTRWSSLDTHDTSRPLFGNARSNGVETLYHVIVERLQFAQLIVVDEIAVIGVEALEENPDSNIRFCFEPGKAARVAKRTFKGPESTSMARGHLLKSSRRGDRSARHSLP